jgi:NADH-quinone oxidoreductase subunit N
MTATFPNLIPALPELFLACIIMALMMFGVFQRGGDLEHDRKSMRVVAYMAITALILTLLLLSLVTGGRHVTFSDMFVTDTFAVFMKVLILVGSAVAILMSQDFMERHGVARFEFPVLIAFATLGMMLMVSANDLMALYLGLEMQSLSLYVAAAIQRDDARATEAGLKYFVLGALASGLLLYGASMVYGFAGSTNFDELAAILANQAASPEGPAIGLVIGIVFVLAGLAFKISAVPFHMWTPDVYEGAPTPVTAFFAAAPKVAALGLLMRVLVGPFGDMVAQWQQVIIFISLGSMILGALAAIAQRNIKRLMAYSSIGHVGYALVGLAAGTQEGVRGVLIYLAIYIVMNLGTFACILAMRRDGASVEDIDDLAGLSRTHPMMAAAMVAFMFSMAGVPPLAGFFGKFYVFLAAIEAQLYALAIIGVVTSVISAFYYLRIVKVMYFDEADRPLDRPVGREIGVVVTGSGLLITLFFVLPGPVLASAASAARALFAG